jgi:hypothetical protein
MPPVIPKRKRLEFSLPKKRFEGNKRRDLQPESREWVPAKNGSEKLTRSLCRFFD